MSRHFGRVRVCLGERSRQMVVDATALFPVQRRCDGFGDEIVRRGPSGLAQADQAGPSEGIEFVEHDGFNAVPRPGNQAGGHFTTEERQQPQGLPFSRRTARRSPLDGAPLTLPGDALSQLDGVGPHGLPSAAAVGDDRAIIGQAADDLRDGEGSPVRVPSQRVGQGGVRHEFADRGR